MNPNGASPVENISTQNVDVPLSPSHIEESMWSSFQNILTFISLAFFAGSLHALWSMFINHWLPSVDSGYLYSISSYLLNPSIATFIVSAPIFILLFLITNKKYNEHPELKRTKTKKILNYIALVITFIILIGRTVSIVSSALNDSLTANFEYQVLLTFLVCGSIFAYYLYEVRIEKQVSNFILHIILSVCLSLLTIGTLILSFDVRQKIKIKSQEISKQYSTPTPRQTNTNQLNNDNLNIATNNSINTILAESINLPSQSTTLNGIDFIIDSADIYSSGGNNFLELNLIFAANMPCPLTGGAVCGVNSIGIRGYDKDSFKLEPFLTADVINDKILNEGEKVKGKYIFRLTEIKDSYDIVYGTPDGSVTPKIEVILKIK